MVISSIFFFNREQWGDTTFTFDVNSSRQPTLAEASLNTTVDGPVHAVGIRSFLTRNTPVSEEAKVDFGRNYWKWPGAAFNQTMTQVTFACLTSADDARLMSHFHVTVFEF
jgi:hypothetical protein